MPQQTLTFLGICGSLRKGSYNRMTLNAGMKLLPEGVVMETFDIRAIPPYDEDVREKGFPEPVEQLRQKIAQADAIVFATPEYNYSVTGVLKNAIDWASRPPDQPFDGKPVGIMGASPGIIGTARAQHHLRQICVYLNAFPVNRPQVTIPQAQNKFDDQGHLKDEATQKFIADLMQSLADWTRRLKR